jgi:hypothetical protein
MYSILVEQTIAMVVQRDKETKMSSQVITLAQVKEAALAAYKAGLLTAQLPSQEAQCKYEIGKHHCAIGACLTPETLFVINQHGLNDSGLISLREADLISVEDIEERFEIEHIQGAHDAWCNELQWSERPAAIKRAEARFCSLIGMEIE